MGNTTGSPKQRSSKQHKVSKQNSHKSSINGLNIDQIDDEELTALKQVCLSYIDMIEFVIDSIPEKKENETEPEPDFEEVFLQLKTFVTSAKRQLGRQEIDAHNKQERTLKLTAPEINALPDLPTEEPPTPSNKNGSSPQFHTFGSIDNSLHSGYGSLSVSSMLSESEASTLRSGHRSQQSSMGLALRKIAGRRTVAENDLLKTLKTEKARIKAEMRAMHKELKQRKFELLPNSLWYDYLLLYLCRSEQFILSATCTYCHKKCGIDSYNFSEQFEFDNIYWRNNFFNFIDPSQDCTILIEKNKFESLTQTQKTQLKYYIKFWDKFICEKENRSKQRQIESKMDDSQIENNNHISEAQNSESEEMKTENENKNTEMKDSEIETENNGENKEEIEDDLLSDLYGADNDDFVYDNDRPKGLQLLEKYRIDTNFDKKGHNSNAKFESQIAIPCDCEQLIIRDCRNRNKDLSHWLYSVLCYIDWDCCIDWLGLENNNFADQDIHRICAGLLNRKTQSNLIGLSLSNNTNITDKAIHILLKTISKKCHKLQFLKINGCVKLTNKTCQTILDFYAKTFNDDKVQLSYVDLSQNYKINDKGIAVLNQIYLHQQYTPFNVVVRFYVAGTTWNCAMEDWSKNIILKPPKRR